MYQASVRGDVATALPVYRALHELLRWDSETEFVQAIKLSMDVVGRYGGPCRLPRLPLSDADAARVRELTEKALAAGYC
jgi:4-hydroxy-tetrahydrodipicolinate synthase